MAGRVDQVDLVTFLFNAGRGAGDRDPAFSFQFHVVHRGTVTVTTDLFDLVNPTGVEQDRARSGSFCPNRCEH